MYQVFSVLNPCSDNEQFYHEGYFKNQERAKIYQNKINQRFEDENINGKAFVIELKIKEYVNNSTNN